MSFIVVGFFTNDLMNQAKLKAIEKKPARIVRKRVHCLCELYNYKAARRVLGKRMNMNDLIDYLLASYVHAARANKKGKK